MPIQYYRVYPSSHGLGVGLRGVLFGISTTKPARFAPVWHDRGPNDPPRPIARGPTPPQLTGGQPTRPNRCKPPPIAPRKRGPPEKPRPIKPGLINWGQSNGANKPRQTNPKQSPKQSPNRWGPIAPQTGQMTNPGQPPEKPKQPRKRKFEVSAYLLSKAKKTPVLPGVVLVLRQLPKIINIKL
jgi:hypothetical protein